MLRFNGKDEQFTNKGAEVGGDDENGGKLKTYIFILNYFFKKIKKYLSQKQKYNFRLFEILPLFFKKI